MTIELDHTIVPSRSQVKSAKLLAELFGVSWAENVDPFSPVYVNSGLMLDFQETDEDFPIYHFCFRVTEDEFDAILDRIKAAGIKYRSTLRGSMDMQINTELRGRMIYWNEPDGHQWELWALWFAERITLTQVL